MDNEPEGLEIDDTFIFIRMSIYSPLLRKLYVPEEVIPVPLNDMLPVRLLKLPAVYSGTLTMLVNKAF